jgi:hypothetical protein
MACHDYRLTPGRRQLVNKRSLMLATATAVVIALLPATAFASTGTPRTSAPATVKVNGLSFNAKDAKCTSAKGGTERCTQAVRVPLKDLTAAQRTERQRAMVKIAARSKARPALSAQPDITAPAECDFSSIEGTLTVDSNPSRFISCSDVLWLDYVLIYEDGVWTLAGTFYFEDQSWILYSASSLSWTHGMQTIGYTDDATGLLADGVSGFLYSNCWIAPGICSATSLTGLAVAPVSIDPGGTYTFEWDESDTGPASTTTDIADDLADDLGVVWEITTEAIGTGYETGFLVGRCDSEVGSSSGCVNEDFTPTLSLSLAQYGAAAYIIYWAQNNLTPWGSQAADMPLTRLADTATREANRAAICGDGTFVNEGSAIGGNDSDSDSCDEFPFAGTYQSAGYAGFTGAACAQVTAVPSGTTTGNEAADWPAVAVSPNTTYITGAPCVRGHVPLALNSAVGGAYGNLILSNRLIDGDPFWVAVTP